MPDIDREIDQRIRSFLDELNALVRSAAIEAVAKALGAKPPSPARAAVARAASPPAALAPPSGARPASRRARNKGEKRPPRELARVQALLEKHVRENPGQGIEAIGKALQMPTSELTPRPMDKLLAAGKVLTTGERRATRYYPGGGGAAATPAPKPAAKPAPKQAARPAAKPAPKPAAKPAPKPAAKPAAKPAPKPAPKPAAKPAPRVAKKVSKGRKK